MAKTMTLYLSAYKGQRIPHNTDYSSNPSDKTPLKEEPMASLKISLKTRRLRCGNSCYFLRVILLQSLHSSLVSAMYRSLASSYLIPCYFKSVFGKPKHLCRGYERKCENACQPVYLSYHIPVVLKESTSAFT